MGYDIRYPKKFEQIYWKNEPIISLAKEDSDSFKNQVTYKLLVYTSLTIPDLTNVDW